MLENKQIKHLKEELIRSGNNFLGILNDIKRQPENAAEELGVSINQINSIIKGEEPISFELIFAFINAFLPASSTEIADFLFENSTLR